MKCLLFTSEDTTRAQGIIRVVVVVVLVDVVVVVVVIGTATFFQHSHVLGKNVKWNIQDPILTFYSKYL